MKSPFTKRIGPAIRRTIHGLECYGCQHLSRSLWRSGRNPVYQSFCQHPQATESDPLSHSRSHPNESGRFITRNVVVHTPQWCPVVAKQNPKPSEDSKTACGYCGEFIGFYSLAGATIKLEDSPEFCDEICLEQWIDAIDIKMEIENADR